MQLLSEGGKATFYIPSALGYGPTNTITDIPANSIIIIEVELLEVIPNPE
jgi:FKBP-type peptidyl-prolyl cis-trans isomerase FkpA/FKBP-type peptidyl-prolyl cis-trans isomerase FklB